MKDRFIGAFLGLVVGDTLGAPFEFLKRDEFEFKGCMEKGGHHDVKIGQWTDDTSLALCLAESLIKDGFDLNSQMNRYVKWYKDGYLSSKDTAFDVGNNTALSIEEYINKKELPPKRERAAGNGSIMRLAPVPLYYIDSLNKAVHYSGLSSITTHNNEMAIDSCKYLGAMIYYAVHGNDKNFLHSKVVNNLNLDERVINIVSKYQKNKSKSEINSDGFVLNTLDASLWCFYNTDDFYSAMVEAVNLGDDTDTVAAVTGQIAGAYYGASNIPDKWINKLAKKELIMGLIRGLHQTKKI